MSVIRILHPLEIREYETPPLFDSFNRKKFLTLPAALASLLETSRHPASKIALIVQCGYFRACHRFFGSQFRADDLAFVAVRLELPKPEVWELSRQTLLRQREAIAECFGARQFQPTDRRTLADEIAGWVCETACARRKFSANRLIAAALCESFYRTTICWRR